MKKIVTSVVLSLAIAAAPAAVYAATTATGQLSQTIGAGSLATDIVDGSGVHVTSPSFAMANASVQTACQTITGSYGSGTQRVMVDNPGAANSGWTLAIAADTGVTGWKNAGNTTVYKYDDATGSGCTNGQLSLNPAAATLGLNGTSTNTGITQGTAAAFTSGSSITLMTASGSANQVWNGYLTNIGVSQKIPAYTPADTYTIQLKQTVTAS